MGTSSGDGRMLRELREAAGVSLGQFVRLTDYSKGHLSKVENGLRPASAHLVRVYESLRERPAVAAAPQPSRQVVEPWHPVALSYGGEIRRARIGLGLSQRDLAEAVGIRHVYVSKLENGHSLGTPYVAGRLDKKLGLDGALLNLFTAESNRAPVPVTIPGVALLAGVGPVRPLDVAEVAA